MRFVLNRGDKTSSIRAFLRGHPVPTHVRGDHGRHSDPQATWNRREFQQGT
jgi:hypothetical protein